MATDRDENSQAAASRSGFVRGFVAHHENADVDPPTWVLRHQAARPLIAAVFCLYFAWGRPSLQQGVIAFSLCLAFFVLPKAWARRAVRRGAGLQAGGDREAAPGPPIAGSGRVICYGTPRELSALTLDFHFREPYVAAVGPYDTARVLSAMFMLLNVLLILRVVNLPMLLLVCGASALALGAISYTLPRERYYRVAPRRLDVLRGRAWGTRLMCEARVPLEDARIICRFDERKLFITQRKDEDAEAYVIDLRRLAEPHAFAKAVFEAAISPHPTLPLPDDALSG